MKTTINNQKGFTLIELVVVMVILALLAAVAVPKFMDLQKQAEAASVKKVIGNLKSALSLRTAKALVDGEPMADVITALNAGGVMENLLANKPEAYLGAFAANQTETGVWFDRTDGWIMYRLKNTDIVTAKSGSNIYNNSIILRLHTIVDAGEDVGLELIPARGSRSYDYTWEY